LALEVSGDKTVVPLIVGKPDLSRLPLIRGKDYLEWRNDPQLVAIRLREALARTGANTRGPRPARPTTGSVPPVDGTARQPTSGDRPRTWLQGIFGRPR
jgi:hypothetical protein